MNFWKRLFRGKNRKEQYDASSRSEEEYLISRKNVNLADNYERGKYVQSLLEQIADANEQLIGLNAEYKTVDRYLKDMEEVEYISGEDRGRMQEYARAIAHLEKDKEKYQKKKNGLSDEDFAKMQRLEDDSDEGVKRLREAEEYQNAIRSDLQRLECEKQACLYRKEESLTAMINLRGMAMICVCAIFVCLLVLLILQFAMKMQVKIGYILTTAAAAISLTAIYMKYLDASAENIRSARSLNKVILLQNRVKIRYVNNTSLLDYLYLKFGIASAKELSTLMEKYTVEKVEREKLEEAMEDLNYHQEQMVKLLKKYQLYDPIIWIHQPQAILDSKEMVEVRHALILRRQQIRKQLDFNTVNAEKAQGEIRDLVGNYPQFAKEILKMVSDYQD